MSEIQTRLPIPRASAYKVCFIFPVKKTLNKPASNQSMARPWLLTVLAWMAHVLLVSNTAI